MATRIDVVAPQTKVGEGTMTELHRLLWAKSAKKDTPDNWKPVLAHLLDVAACAWEESHLAQPKMEVNRLEVG
jgi:HD domain